jgi:hypothetical protein
MTSTERVEREIENMKHQMETKTQEDTPAKRSGYFGFIGVFIIGFILGMVVEYFLLA